MAPTTVCSPMSGELLGSGSAAAGAAVDGVSTRGEYSGASSTAKMDVCAVYLSQSTSTTAAGPARGAASRSFPSSCSPVARGKKRSPALGSIE